MKIEHKDMKSCFTCRCADAFIIPNKCHFDYDEIKVECVVDTTADKLLYIGGGCPNYEPCCNHKTILKES